MRQIPHSAILPTSCSVLPNFQTWKKKKKNNGRFVNAISFFKYSFAQQCSHVCFKFPNEEIVYLKLYQCQDKKKPFTISLRKMNNISTKNKFIIWCKNRNLHKLIRHFKKKSSFSQVMFMLKRHSIGQKPRKNKQLFGKPLQYND